MDNQDKAKLLSEIEYLKSQLQDVTEDSLEEAAKKEYDIMMADVSSKYETACEEAVLTCSNAKDAAEKVHIDAIAAAKKAYETSLAAADAAYVARSKELEENKAKLENDVLAYLEQLRAQNKATIQSQEIIRKELEQKQASLRAIEEAEEAARKAAEEAERARIAEEEARKAATARPRIRF